MKNELQKLRRPYPGQFYRDELMEHKGYFYSLYTVAQ